MEQEIELKGICIVTSRKPLCFGVIVLGAAVIHMVERSSDRKNTAPLSFVALEKSIQVVDESSSSGIESALVP